MERSADSKLVGGWVVVAAAAAAACSLCDDRGHHGAGSAVGGPARLSAFRQLRGGAADTA